MYLQNLRRCSSESRDNNFLYSTCSVWGHALWHLEDITTCFPFGSILWWFFFFFLRSLFNVDKLLFFDINILVPHDWQPCLFSFQIYPKYNTPGFKLWLLCCTKQIPVAVIFSTNKNVFPFSLWRFTRQSKEIFKLKAGHCNRAE